MSDYVGRASRDIEAALLSRALAAHAIRSLEGSSLDQAAHAVVDQFDDQGIDGCYFNEAEKRLLLCQSKWSSAGNRSIDLASVHKFLGGVDKLVSLRLEGFGEKTLAMKERLEAALVDSEVMIRLALTHSGDCSLGDPTTTELGAFLDRHNTPEPLFELEVLDQGRNYAFLLESSQGVPIDLEVTLQDWGQITEPYIGFYGRANVADIALWWQEYGPRLFAENIRDFRGRTDVNSVIASSLASEPHHFWYFNNGITLLCESVRRKPLGATSRKLGQFDCSRASIANGAQTVGQIGNSLAEGALVDGLEEAQVLIRLISLEGCPSGFGKRVTRATNTQNRVEGRDFAALDENQKRLAQELSLEDYSYSYRTGLSLAPNERACDVTDAAIALACAQEDVALAVQVKREVGRIFSDLESAPYLTVFPATLEARKLRNAVRIMRSVDSRLETEASRSGGFAKLVATHGNRFILHLVFKNKALRGWELSDPGDTDVEARAAKMALETFEKLKTYFAKVEPSVYPQPLFKATERCRELVGALEDFEDLAPEPEQPWLWE